MPTNYQQPTSTQGYTRYPTPIPARPGFWEGANVQGQANIGAGQDTTRISNPNQFTPYGSQTVSYSPDGTPTINQQFSPEQQTQFGGINQQMNRGLGQIDRSLSRNLGDYRFSQVDPFSMSGAPEINPLNTEGMTDIGRLTNAGLFDINPIDTSGLTQRQTMPTVGAQSMVAEALREREAPRFDRRRSRTENDLLVRGFNPGTEGYDARMDEVDRAQNDFNLGLTALSGQEQSRLFDMESGLRGQELDEMLAEFGTTSQARGQLFGERRDIFGSELARRQQEMDERGQVFDAQGQDRSRALAEALARWDTQTGDRGREIDEQVLARGLPIREYAQMQALQPNLPQFQGFTGANVDPGNYQTALQQQGLFDLGRYGTSIQGELGTRGIDRDIKTGNRAALFDLLGSGLEAYGWPGA